MVGEIAQGHLRQNTKIEKLARSKVFWILFCLFFFSYPIVRSVFRELPKPLPVYYEVPSFELINQFDKSFGSNDLKGKVYIASFAFTSCPSTCPKLMETMQKVQKRVRGLRDRIALLTISVDPKTDTPKVLNKFSRDYKANPNVWSFLTGEPKDIYNLLVNGYKVSVGGKEPTIDGMYDIAHSEKLVLVDGEGKVRGYYPTDKMGINKLMIDVGLLVNNSFSYN